MQMWNLLINTAAFQKCRRQSASCTTDQCDNVCDGDNNTCVLVPHDTHPWSLKLLLQVGCIQTSSQNTFDVIIIGKKLSCSADHLKVAYHSDEHHQGVDVMEGKFTLCNIVGETSDDVTLSCLATCERALRMPEVVFVEIVGGDMELCEAMLGCLGSPKGLI